MRSYGFRTPPMTIWRTLLLSFLAVSLLPTTGITLLTFDQTRKALEAEIARNLLAEASAVMERIDWMLFERLENVRTWTQLEVMQELRIGDIDKRVSHALADLKAGYGVYAQLFCTAADGQVVAASDPHTFGQQVPTQPPWLAAALPEGTVLLDPLSFSAPAAHLRLHATIADMFQHGKTIGTLYALFDWTEIPPPAARFAAKSCARLLAACGAGAAHPPGDHNSRWSSLRDGRSLGRIRALPRIPGLPGIWLVYAGDSTHTPGLYAGLAGRILVPPAVDLHWSDCGRGFVPHRLEDCPSHLATGPL